MKDKVSYEWVCEPLDEHGDIIDPLFGDTLAEVIRFGLKYKGAAEFAYALVRNVGNDIDGIKDREYAYLDHLAQLPDEFPSGAQVPQRFHQEKGA